MKQFCNVIPQIKDKQTNEMIGSKLFMDLLSVMNNNRNRAIDLYYRVMNPQFKQVFGEYLEYDQYDQPTLHSLMSVPGIEEFINENNVINKLRKDINFDRKEANDNSISDAIDKSVEFNKENKFNDMFVANVTVDNTKKVDIRLQEHNNDRLRQAHDMAVNRRLNKLLREILQRHNINVGILSEQEMVANGKLVYGKTDFNQALTFANGMSTLIKISKGKIGESKLPEEFAHTAIRAMKGNILVDRLIDYLNQNEDRVNEILGDERKFYESAYGFDKNRLIEEAAGKLLADKLIRSIQPFNEYLKERLNRAWNAIKGVFKKFDEKEIEVAVDEANKYAQDIANNILNTKSLGISDIKQLYSKDVFYHLEEDANRAKEFLEKVIDIELKRLRMFKNRQKGDFVANQKQMLYDIHNKIEAGQEIQGVYEYVLHELRTLESLSNRFESIKDDSKYSERDRAKLLRDIKNYIGSYILVNDKYANTIKQDAELLANEQIQEAQQILDRCTKIISDLNQNYSTLSKDVTLNLLRPMLGDSIEIAYGKYKGKYTLEEIITKARHDITVLDRWLNSAANTNDFAIKGIDQRLKRQNVKARKEVIEYKQAIYAAAKQLKEAGIHDFSWMYERFDDGTRTGNYIEKYNYGKFNRDKAAFFTELNKKYGKNPNNEKQREQRKKEIKEWNEKHTQAVDGYATGDRRYVPSNEYLNDYYKRIMRQDEQLNQAELAQKNFYIMFMITKHRMDKCLPDKSTQPNRTIKIRKDLVERVLQSDSVRQGAGEVWDAIRDDFVKRSDNIDFGYIPTIKDFNDHTVLELPIFYTRRREDESEEDISMDAVSTLLAYCDMALKYKYMNEFLDQLEIARDFLTNPAERKVVDTINGIQPKKEKFREQGITYEDEVYKEKSRINERLNDMYLMQVYQKYMADEGTFGNTKIDRGKTANFINKITALNVYALNFMSGISNVMTGNAMMKIEGFCGQFVTSKEIKDADKAYRKELMKFIGELGSNIKTNKISLFDEMFDIMQDYDKNITDLNWTKQGFKKFMEGDTLYFMNNVGEHWMQNRTGIALAMHYKMLDNNGKETNLWDALEIKYYQGVDERGKMIYGKENKGLGAKLFIKEGYKKADGTEFTEEDEYKFERRSVGLNHRMHGIYNKQDQNAIQTLGWGRMAIMFRKYMKPAWDRRFGYSQYDADLDAVTEGYYMTTFRFLGMLKDNLLESHKLMLSDTFKNMTEDEQFNLKRSIRETISFTLMLALCKLFDYMNDDDDDESFADRIGLDFLKIPKQWKDDGNLWHQFIKTNAMIGQAISKREALEIGQMTPFKNPKRTLLTPLKLLDSPAAAINTLEGTIGLLDLMVPKNYYEILQSGPYKGHTKAYKALMKSPASGPLKQWNRTVHPEHLIKWMDI